LRRGGRVGIEEGRVDNRIMKGIPKRISDPGGGRLNLQGSKNREKEYRERSFGGEVVCRGGRNGKEAGAIPPKKPRCWPENPHFTPVEVNWLAGAIRKPSPFGGDATSRKKKPKSVPSDSLCNKPWESGCVTSTGPAVRGSWRNEGGGGRLRKGPHTKQAQEGVAITRHVSGRHQTCLGGESFW